MANLSESQRSALLLCHFQDFSNKEAATIAGLSVRALESLMARAKRNLRLQLEANLYEQ
jgi:RNA polymerase sigma-70 factor (ECF subfamily)